MTLVNLDPKWEAWINPAWMRALDSSPFLTRCREKTVSREELETFIVQQYFYARHFTRYLCALLSNLKDETDRFELSQNLFEEMGLGGLGSIPHSRLYAQMMERMGLHPEEHKILPSTERLADRMLNACRNKDPMVGLGTLCLGAEAIVPHLYSQIVTGFEALNEPQENLEFFLIHISGDDEHAVTMRRIIAREVSKDTRQNAPLVRAARDIIQARAAFFEGLSATVEQDFVREEREYAAVQLQRF